MSTADAEFVRDAAARWSKLLDYVEDKDAHLTAVSISLWATMNVDRLLGIAERRTFGSQANGG
jgi:hypothetical protein